MKYKKLIVIVLVIGVLLRFTLASIHHVSGDACWILSVARFIGENYQIPLFEDLGRDSVFSRPPLFHIIAGIFYNLFGIFNLENFGLKMVSPLAGSLTLILFYFLARKFYNERITFIAVTVFAFFPLHIYYSTLSYVESTVGLFALVALYLIIENRVVLSAIFAGMTAMLKFEGIFMIPTLLLILYHKNKEKFKIFIKKALVFLLVSSIVFIPYLMRNFIYLGNPVWPHLSRIIKGYPVVDQAYLDSTITNLFDITGLTIPYLELFGVPNGNYKVLFFFNIPYINLLLGLWLAATIFYFSLFIFGLIKSNKKYAPNRFLLAWILVYVILVVLTTIFQDIPQSRFLIPALPAFMVFWAIGINEILKIRKYKAPILVLISLIIVGFVAVEFGKTSLAANSWNSYQDDFDWINQNTVSESTIFYTGQCLAYNADRFTTYSYAPLNKEYLIPQKIDEVKEAYVWVNQDFNLEPSAQLPTPILTEIESNYELIYSNQKTRTKLYKIK